MDNRSTNQTTLKGSVAKEGKKNGKINGQRHFINRRQRNYQDFDDLSMSEKFDLYEDGVDIQKRFRSKRPKAKLK